jgi:hypothetical protein
MSIRFSPADRPRLAPDREIADYLNDLEQIP